MNRRKRNFVGEAARRIERVRDGAGLTQVQIAKQLGVVPSLVSGIENGRIAKPSAEMFVRLARFAAANKFTSDAQWFLDQAGFDKAALDAVTAVQKPNTSDVVVVLPMAGSAGDPLPFPRKLVAKKAKLKYLTVTEESVKTLGGTRGDRIVLDTSITNHTLLWGRVIVLQSPGTVRLARPSPAAKPEWTQTRPMELLIGRLQLTPTTHDALQYKAELAPAFGRQPTKAVEPEKWLGWYPEPPHAVERHSQERENAESEARQHIALGFGYHVLGRFVAWIGSETAEDSPKK